MRKRFKNIMLIATTLFTALTTTAQDTTDMTVRLWQSRIDAYPMAVTHNKTSHLIFSAPIRYVDLGSDNLIAGKASEADNVLRVKAMVRDFEGETNFSVITEDGKFYSFDAYYSSFPEALNYDLSSGRPRKADHDVSSVLLEDLGTNSPYFTNLVLSGIYNKNERPVRHISSKSYGIRFILKGIYIHNGKFYFHTELRNSSNVPYQIDYITFKVVDRKMAKRTALQEKPITPLRMFQPLGKVDGGAKQRNILLLDQFTITDDKLLVIEIFERNGGRHQKLELEQSDLVAARLITDINLDIK